jgi:hypothetical protein
MAFRGRVPAEILSPMTATAAQTHHWGITSISGTGTASHRAGTATSRTEAWTQALAAGRAALLAGELATLAVTVDDDVPTAHYAPGRDEDGALDPAQVTAALVEIHQAVTAGDLADQLAAGPGQNSMATDRPTRAHRTADE